jgi:hypothetical protein
VILAGPVTVNPDTREARAYGDLLLVTIGEFDLLAVLAAEPHREWTLDELLDRIPSAHERGGYWLHLCAWRLSGQLVRVGVRNDLARSDGLYRLFEPGQGGES